MAIPTDLRPGSRVHESSPLPATAKLMTAGGLMMARGPQCQRRHPPTLHRGRERTYEIVGPRPMLPHRLSVSRCSWPASTVVANRRSWGGGGVGGEYVCEGVVFWEAHRRARGGQERTREARPRCPRPCKRGLDLGWLWVVPDATAIRFWHGSACWAALLSGLTHLDARARDESPRWGWHNGCQHGLIKKR
jgi:hypothetical protein